MAKSVWRKVIIAGTYVCALQYRRSTDPDVKRLRSPKREVSSDIRDAINLRNSYQKFKVLLACNFVYTDLVVTLTYSDDRLPSRRADAPYAKALSRRACATCSAISRIRRFGTRASSSADAA